MKKILAMALLLTLVVGVAFAQVSGFGRVRTCVGVNVPFGDPDPSWLFPHTHRLGLRGSTDVINFFAQADFARTIGTVRAKATADLGAWSLAFGQNELPWVRWSSLAYQGNNNFQFGASTSAVIPFVYASFLDNQVYVGITDGGTIHEAIINSFPVPGFFVGGDFEVTDGISVGGAFAGLVNTPSGADNIFTFMAKAHASIAAGPATVGVNVAFYQNAYSTSFFSLANPFSLMGNPDGGDDLTLEAMVDFRLPLDPGALSVTVGYLHNLSDYDGSGSAIRIGGSFSFSMGGGFSIIPGFILTGPVAGSASFGDYAVLQAGVTFFFGF